MDVRRFGAFVAECRREQGLTQAELAARLHVTDKAVSRWERGVGFPDIQTLEPLAAALEISVLELLRSERIPSGEVAKEAADGVVLDALRAAHLQRRQERRRTLYVLGAAAGLAALVLLLDSVDWRWDAVLFTALGVWLPLFCMFGFLALLGYGIWRKRAGKAHGRTLWAACACLLFLLLFLGAFVLAGALGLGPVAG